MEQEIKRRERVRKTGKAVSLLSLLLSCQKCAESSVSTQTLSSLFFFNDILGEVTAKFLRVYLSLTVNQKVYEDPFIYIIILIPTLPVTTETQSMTTALY